MRRSIKGLVLAVGLMSIVSLPELSIFPRSIGISSQAATWQSIGSSITGFVFDESRRPVANVMVELLDDVDFPIKRIRTDGSGRYLFTGLKNGKFSVRVRPLELNCREETKDASIENFSQGSSSGTTRTYGGQSLQVNFDLKPLRPEEGPPGSIFVGDRDAPAEAKKLYESGLAHLKKNETQQGFDDLKSALTIFPTYYAALERLGVEYLRQGGDFTEAAAIILEQAAKVNSRSFNAFYGLGQARFRLKLYSEAVESFNTAVTLYPASPYAHIWLGKAYRQVGKLDKAEAALQKARKLEDNLSDVHWQLALVYNDLKRYQDAINELEKVLKLEPDTPNAENIRTTIKKLREKLGTS